jgi:transposase
VRVTTAFSTLLRPRGVWVKRVRFEPDGVIVKVALRRKKLRCPKCSYSTWVRKDTRPEDSVWRHLDLGVWRIEIHCRRRRLWCPVHGARTEGCRSPGRARSSPGISSAWSRGWLRAPTR